MKTLSVVLLLSLVSTALFADADLSVVPVTTGSTFVAGARRLIAFTIRNNGPDVAKDVVVTITGSNEISGNCTAGCAVGNGTMAIGEQLFNPSLLFPDTPGDVTVTASVTSSSPDPNSGNNSASVTVHLSPNPDVSVFLRAPLHADLALPFQLSINVSNESAVIAHDVNTTVDFRPDVTVKTLPGVCTNPAAGRVVCHSDAMSQGSVPAFVVTLVAPPTYGSGSIDITATSTELEPDFDPSSNIARASIPLNLSFYVTTVADSGAGSLRQAILDANAAGSDRLLIGFRIAEPSTTPWKTIRIASPLPPLTASGVRIDGGTQASFFGRANPDGPDIEISGGGSIDGDGLLVTHCDVEVANLAINGFLRNGISIAEPLPSAQCPTRGAFLHHLFIGTDPTGTIARPNARGIGTSFANGNSFTTAGAAAVIQDSVISGNTHSGIFGLSGRMNISRNRIGVKAHSDDPLPNGNAGVFIGLGGYGSDVGSDFLTAFSAAPGTDSNVIAFNGQMGVAVAAGVADVAIRNNHIWHNALLGIDIGLDGPTQTSAGISMPSLTIAHYDPVLGKTVIEGDVSRTDNTFSVAVDFFANDAPDPTGLGEGQRPLGNIQIQSALPSHFRFAVDGNLTGQFISATLTRIRNVGFAKPEGISQGFLTQTSEFSPAIEVR